MELMKKCRDDDEYIGLLISLKNITHLIYKIGLEECEACAYFEKNDFDDEDLKCICDDKNNRYDLYNDSLANVLVAIIKKEESYEKQDNQEAL